MVAVISVTLLDDRIGTLGLVATGLIVAGIMGLGLDPKSRNPRGLLLSLLTGVLIGVYTLIDRLGGRAGLTPHAYVACLFLMLAITLPAIAAATQGRDFMKSIGSTWVKDFCTGLISAGGYWIAIWAMSVSPMALVASVRESSVAFAAILGSLILKERVQWVYVLLVLAGVVLARIVNS